MAFLSMPGEVCLDSLLDQAIREGRHVYVPRCLSRGVMEAVRLDSVTTAVNGEYGIRTAPAESPAASPDTLDLILVPGVAFDEDGRRLGHGTNKNSPVIGRKCDNSKANAAHHSSDRDKPRFGNFIGIIPKKWL